MINLIAPFFSCFLPSGSLSRSMVLAEAGGATMVSSFPHPQSSESAYLCVARENVGDFVVVNTPRLVAETYCTPIKKGCTTLFICTFHGFDVVCFLYQKKNESYVDDSVYNHSRTRASRSLPRPHLNMRYVHTVPSRTSAR